MASLKDLLPSAVTADIDLGLGGPKLRVTYDPRKITSINAEAAGADNPNQILAQARSICQVVTAIELNGPVPLTDLEDGTKEGSVIAEGQPVPLDPLVLTFLPIPIIQGIVYGLTRHAQPDPTRQASGSPGRS